MSVSIAFPGKITAGLNFTAEITATDYTAPLWQVYCILRGPGVVNIAAQSEGPTHRFSATGAETAEWAPGLYAGSIRADDGAGNVHEISSGTIQIVPDLAQIETPHDARSENVIALEAISAVLSNRATLDQQRYRINNRELWREPISELMRLEAFYRVRVNREKSGNRAGRLIPVIFSQR